MNGIVNVFIYIIGEGCFEMKKNYICKLKDVKSFREI